MVECLDFERGALMVTKANHMSGTLHLLWPYDFGHNFTLRVTVGFKVIPQSHRHRLPTRYTSTMNGFITSLGFQLGLLYPDEVTSWTRIVVPPNHGLMLSIPKLHLASVPIDCLDVFLVDLHHRLTHVQHECGMNIVSAQVYSSVRLATVNITSGRNFQGTGFKLMFSFHELDRLPQKLPSGLFNCSRGVYLSFRQHLHCNLDYECDEGQDETGDCPYSSDQCHGQLASGNRCLFVVGMDRLRHNTSSWMGNTAISSAYTYHDLKRDYIHSAYQGVSWSEAAEECEENNGRLAAFATDQQWQDMLKIWTHSKVSTTRVFIGLKTKWKRESSMYRNVMKFSDRTMVYYINQRFRMEDSAINWERGSTHFRYLESGPFSDCGMGEVILASRELIIQLTDCNKQHLGSLVLCERTLEESYVHASEDQKEHTSTISEDDFFFHRLTWNSTIAVDSLCDNQSQYTLMVCPCGHVTHSFLSCDLNSYCGEERYVDECPVLSPKHCQSRMRQWYAQYEQFTEATGERVRANASSHKSHSLYLCTSYTDKVGDLETPPSVAMFVCSNQDTVHYSLVCDFRPDCLDETDETFCIHPNCDGFRCSNGQCIASEHHCDHKVHCLDDSDEDRCQAMNMGIPRHPPNLINFEGDGGFVASDWSDSQPCPDTHYRCNSLPRYCLPVYTRCNEYYDCAGREDELECDDVGCPGLYRCRGSRVCVHVRHLCDGSPQCPQHDDEWLCQPKPCPASCLCQGLAFVCDSPFPFSNHPDLRYVVMDSSPVALTSFSHYQYLINLSLVRCLVSTLSVFVSLPNLQTLDLRYNNITTFNLTLFEELPNLKILKLSHNPILDVINGESGKIVSAVHIVDLSNTLLQTFATENLSFYSHVKQLNLSHSKVVTLSDSGFQLYRSLEVLDMRGCSLQRFRLDMFRGLQRLKIVFSPNNRLCCDGILPGQVTKPTCFAPADHLSSCTDLLMSRVYQVMLFVTSIVAISGSVICLLSRYARHQRLCNTGCELMVSGMNVVSLLMGMYAGVIAVADEVYRGRYVFLEQDWTESVACQMACMLHLFSHQVSMLTVLVITLDRLVVLCFPRCRLRLSVVSAAAVCCMTWCVGLVVVVVQSVLAWPLHKQSALCVPLPVPTDRFAGYNFHFGAVILQTLIIGSLVLVSQVFIVFRIKQTGVASLSTASADSIFTARIYPIALVNALCWLCVSVYGLVTKLDATPVESQLNVVLAVVIFPFPAAFSPLALIYKRWQEDKRRDKEAKMLKILLESVSRDRK